MSLSPSQREGRRGGRKQRALLNVKGENGSVLQDLPALREQP
nr:MAG TPA: hypothetical protein [Caudoviricetes sp.]DAM33776.1 MAG TPA: hypothetical protein [Caudoviricetes sp.]